MSLFLFDLLARIIWLFSVAFDLIIRFIILNLIHSHLILKQTTIQILLRHLCQFAYYYKYIILLLGTIDHIEWSNLDM